VRRSVHTRSPRFRRNGVSASMASANRRTARMTPRNRLAYTIALVLSVLGTGGGRSVLTAQSNGAVPGTIQAYSTITSIGVEWDIVGDADHDATAIVEYRVAGTAAWRSALPLVRVDYNGYNQLSGSILFLSPDTSYEVKLTLADPDGGGERLAERFQQRWL
jgi:hypothetical protein